MNRAAVGGFLLERLPVKLLCFPLCFMLKAQLGKAISILPGNLI